jgi:hypothetical protein
MDREPLRASTWIVLICMCVMALLLLTGCGNAYDDCVERERMAYMDKNPKASYAELQSRQHDFTAECSR